MLVLKNIEHKLGHFPIHHSIWGEIFFFSMEQKKDLPQCSCIFHLFKYVVIIILKVRQSAPHFFTETHVYQKYSIPSDLTLLTPIFFRNIRTKSIHIKIKIICHVSICSIIFVLKLCIFLSKIVSFVLFLHIRIPRHKNFFLNWKTWEPLQTFGHL